MKLYLVYKAVKRVSFFFYSKADILRCHLVFSGNNIQYKSFTSTGVPYVSIAMGGACRFGKNLRLNNGARGNPIGSFNRCTFFVDKGAELLVGDNVGMSQAAIVCHKKITIGNDVKIGGGVCIYDTDFHSTDPALRANPKLDFANKARKPVEIGNNVFIGAFSLILKGVSIGNNSVIGAGSVVTKSIPENQIWAGNPARFVRNL